MIQPSRYVIESKVYQGTKSQLHQRRGLYVLPYTQYTDILCTNSAVRVDDPGYPTVPTPSPLDPYGNGDLAWLQAWDWDTALGAPAALRELVHFFAGYYTTARDQWTSGDDDHPVNPIISRIYNLTWPSLPSAAGTTPQRGSGGFGGWIQSSFWCWLNSYDSYALQYIWETCCQKCRYRYTIDSWGFQAIGDLYANGTSDGGATYYHGWASPNTVDQWSTFTNNRITIENIHLLSTRTNLAPMTWINVDASFPSAAYPNTFRNGFLGRLVFSVDFETPTQFTARTGLTISP